MLGRLGGTTSVGTNRPTSHGPGVVMLGMLGSWAASWQPAGVVAWQTTNAGDAGILGCRLATCMQVLWLDVRDWVENNKCWGCRNLGLHAGWQPASVVAGCEDWVAKKTCCGCRDLGRNLQVLWLDVRTGLQTTNAGDAGVLDCRLALLWLDARTWAICRCCKQQVLGCRDLGLQVSNVQVL